MLRGCLLMLCACVAACTAEQPPLLAEDVVLTRPQPGSGMGAAYLVLHNRSAAALTIDRVTSPDGIVVAMHETRLEDDIMRMRELPALTIPARQSVVFAPGGKHLMLRYPAAIPAAVTLQFLSGPDMLLTIQVHPEE